MTTQPRKRDPDEGTAPHDAPQNLVNRVIDGRFRLDEILNSGGMGIVYRATQLSVKREVAVKVLKPTLSDETDLVQRFSQEIEVVGRLSHPNIVGLIEAGKDAGGLTYLAMEYVHGETFRDALRASKLTLPDVLEVFAQTCDALAEAHALGIVHRDLKFDNIMLADHHDGRIHVKVLDFGVAKLLSSNLELTKSGQVPGTPGIIAPELIDENPPAPQSDLYSLGVLLFTALCGETPFNGQNDLELMRAHKFEDVPRVERRVSDSVPRPLVDLTYDLLSKTPEDRPAGATQVRDRLDDLSSHLGELTSEFPAYVPGEDCIDSTTSRVERDTDVYDFTLEATADETETLEETPPPVLESHTTGVWRADQPETKSPIERFIRSFFGDEPVVAPMTVVFALALLLLILIVAILYLLFPQIAGLVR